LQTLSAALEETRQEETSDNCNPAPYDPIDEIPSSAHLH